MCAAAWSTDGTIRLGCDCVGRWLTTALALADAMAPGPACFGSQMSSAAGPKEAIDAINECAELTDNEYAAISARVMADPKVAEGIAAVPRVRRVATIRQLLASSPAGPTC